MKSAPVPSVQTTSSCRLFNPLAFAAPLRYDRSGSVGTNDKQLSFV